MLLVIALSTHLSPVELGWPQPSWVHVFARFKSRASTTFGRLAPCSRSPRVLALLAPAIGHGRAVLWAISCVDRGRVVP